MGPLIFCIILVILALSFGCLGFPANLETPKEVSETAVFKNEKDNIINNNTTETPLDSTKFSYNVESKLIQVKVLEDQQNFKETKSNEKATQKTDENQKPKENNSNDKENNKKGEDQKLIDFQKDVAQEEITKQSEVWKDFENDFSLFEHRLPDLTEEEFIELNKEDSIPWSFLKGLNVKRNVNEVTAKPEPQQSPIYITVPIVINTHSTLPISLTIGGQNVPLKVPSDNKELNVTPTHVKVVAGNTMVTPTSDFNKIMDYAEPPTRQTNRHRSNIRSKIYARNNNHEVQAYEYNKDDFEK